MDEYTVALGRYLGYPECCIEWFVKRMDRFPDFDSLTDQQEAVHGCNGFIPCPTCAEKVTPSTIGTLIVNRQAPRAYPEFSVDEVFSFKKKFYETNKERNNTTS